MNVRRGIKRIVLVLAVIMGIGGFFFGQFYWNLFKWPPKYYIVASEADPPPPGFEPAYKVPPKGFKLITPTNPDKVLFVNDKESEGTRYYLEVIPGEKKDLSRVRTEVVATSQNQLLVAGFIGAVAAFVATWVVYGTFVWVVAGFRKK